jgi:hypothetical protein
MPGLISPQLQQQRPGGQVRTQIPPGGSWKDRMAAATVVSVTSNRDQRCAELETTVHYLRQELKSARVSCSRLRQENTMLRQKAKLTAAYSRRAGELAAELASCKVTIGRLSAAVPRAVKMTELGWRGGRVPALGT